MKLNEYCKKIGLNYENANPINGIKLDNYTTNIPNLAAKICIYKYAVYSYVLNDFIMHYEGVLIDDLENVIGTCAFTYHGNYKMLCDFEICKEYRNQGYGYAFLKALSLSKEYDYLFVELDNKIMVELCDKIPVLWYREPAYHPNKQGIFYENMRRYDIGTNKDNMIDSFKRKPIWRKIYDRFFKFKK